jgi:capsular polysaccharide transport system permease protein
LAVLYFGLIAPDRYLAEARFIVRKPASIGSATSAAPSISSEQSLQGGDEDAYAVRDFILSRDGMQAMIDHGNLREAIARAGPDPRWHFPGILTGHTDEQLYRYYQSLVTVEHDTGTGVTTLRVQAFNADDARSLAAVVTDAAESLLNRLQTRARQDAIRVDIAEVERTRELAAAAQLALTGFRTRESMIDPTLLAKTVLSTITALSLQVVEASAQLDLLQHASAGSPQIPPLRSRVYSLQTQIDRERASLAGTDVSLAPRIAEYERLALLRDFAMRNYLASLTALETARLDAQHQRVYLERVVQPRAADQAAYPYRVLSILIIFGVGLVAYRSVRPAAPPGPSISAQFR